MIDLGPVASRHQRTENSLTDDAQRRKILRLVFFA
jgi:hypothetical protein